MPKKLHVNLPYIHEPETTEVGQTIVVKAVDENGKPTEWETADMLTESKVTEMINTALGVVETALDEINGEVV